MATRANLYGKSQIVLGDKTSHGGVVISGSATNSWYGIPVARKMDRVYCPKCAPHFFEIAEGLDNCTDTDAALPLATEGHLTTCGAVLIAESAPSRLLLEVLHFSNGRGFDDRYILRDESGQPMPHTYYAAKKLDNPIEYGTTDEAGHTHMFLTGEEESSISFTLRASMTSQTMTDDNGEILRLVARTKTTPHDDGTIKSINTDSTTIEVLVFDSIMTSMGSQFGHVAIDVDGVIYSRAHSKYARIADGNSYRASNQKIRDFEGLVLRVSVDEKIKIRDELERRVKIDAPYSIINNSCSTNIADVLEGVGILAHDPRFKLDADSTALVTPKEVLIVVSRSKRVVRRKQYSRLKE